MMQALQKCLLCAWGLALCIRPISGADERAIIEENQGKALLIYNIAKFTVWPTEMDAKNEPFTFALWNDAPLAEAFRIIYGQQVHGRSFKIIQHEKGKLPIGSEVFIIPKNGLRKFTMTKDVLSTLPILTVTMDPEVFEAGAMVMVEVMDDRLSFSVNLDRVKESGLEISGNLLRHAREVNF